MTSVPSSPQLPGRPASRYVRTVVVAIALIVLTIATYWPVREYGFVNLDDLSNVTRNPLVQNGLTVDGLKTALTTSEPDYWRPLTWLTYMIDTELYDVVALPTTNPKIPLEIPDDDAFGYHLTNIILHALAAAMLLIALNTLTRCFWKSALVAAIFAVHPLRVESVVWITERKDVLSGLFAFVSLWAYAKYGYGSKLQPRPPLNALWFAAATGALVLGLMSKSSLVTLPFVFLLLDYWPLRRFDLSAGVGTVARRITWLVTEKTPMFLVIAGSCYMTILGGHRSVADLSLRFRLSNAIVSYVRYIGKMFWPVDLAVYYPYPGIGGAEPWSTAQAVGALAILALISIIALLHIRRQPSLIVGWLWFVGMLVPVIGLLQVGNQALADRFTYLPGIGLSITVIWLLASLIPNQWVRRIVLGSLAVAMVVGCVAATRHLLPTWSNSDALFQRALDVTTHNRPVHIYYGDYLFYEKRYPEAFAQYTAAADLTPYDAMPRFKLGFLYAQLKEYHKAQKEFEAAVRLDPDYADAHFNIAVMLVRRGQIEASKPHLQKALALQPDKANEYRTKYANETGGAPGASTP